MKKIISFALMSFCLVFQNAYAERWGEMLTLLTEISGYNRQMTGFQQDIDGLTKQVANYMSGHYGYGNVNSKDFQSYGVGATDWASILQLANRGGNGGILGQTIQQLVQQYPIQTQVINKTISDPMTQQYYALQAQTTLATRAASQVDMNRIQEQIHYQQQLQQQIETTSDMKAAVDLMNRLQVENNLIQLQILRQLALSNQQQAVTTQGALNDAVFNANFLKQ